MNSLTQNKYLDGFNVDFVDYDLNAFLHKEVAVEYTASEEEVMLTVGSMISVCGCNVHLLGTRFLIDLVAMYVSNSDFSLNVALQSIAKEHGSTVSDVRECILSCLKYADNFSDKLKFLLGTDCEIDTTDIAEITVALGALYKVHYNYAVGKVLDGEPKNDSEKEVRS